jgi:hypothetical protein
VSAPVPTGRTRVVAQRAAGLTPPYCRRQSGAASAMVCETMGSRATPQLRVARLDQSRAGDRAPAAGFQASARAIVQALSIYCVSPSPAWERRHSGLTMYVPSGSYPGATQQAFRLGFTRCVRLSAAQRLSSWAIGCAWLCPSFKAATARGCHPSRLRLPFGALEMLYGRAVRRTRGGFGDAVEVFPRS